MSFPTNDLHMVHLTQVLDNVELGFPFADFANPVFDNSSLRVFDNLGGA